MAKKIGKLLTMATIAGAAAGAYYYLKKRKSEDSFEDFDDDVNDDLEEFLKNEADEEKREYVPLDFSNENQEEKADEGKSASEIEIEQG